MFGSKKETTNPNVPVAPSTHALNSLVQGTLIEGQVTSENDIRIDGVIKGNLECKAKVIIGPTGFIEGEITCMNAIIEGTFEGILNVKELLNIRKTAKVNGDINTKKLIVESGAIFNVSCMMGKKQLEEAVNAQKKAATQNNTQQQRVVSTSK